MKTNELKELLFCFRQSELPRLRRLSAYFSGQHRILSEQKASGKPDNRLVNNFCRSITDSTVGYFMGIPVSYGGEDGEALAEAVRIYGTVRNSLRYSGAVLGQGTRGQGDHHG